MCRRGSSRHSATNRSVRARSPGRTKRSGKGLPFAPPASSSSPSRSAAPNSLASSRRSSPGSGARSRFRAPHARLESGCISSASTRSRRRNGAAMTQAPARRYASAARPSFEMTTHRPRSAPAVLSIAERTSAAGDPSLSSSATTTIAEWGTPRSASNLGTTAYPADSSAIATGSIAPGSRRATATVRPLPRRGDSAWNPANPGETHVQEPEIVDLLGDPLRHLSPVQGPGDAQTTRHVGGHRSQLHEAGASELDRVCDGIGGADEGDGKESGILDLPRRRPLGMGKFGDLREQVRDPRRTRTEACPTSGRGEDHPEDRPKDDRWREGWPATRGSGSERGSRRRVEG